MSTMRGRHDVCIQCIQWGVGDRVDMNNTPSTLLKQEDCLADT